jgi:hypothetical protein
LAKFRDNPGKKLVDFLNFQTLSPSPLIQCWYLGDMCCKSTLPESTLFGGGRGGGFKLNSCFNWKMLTFSSYVLKFECIFQKVYIYFFQDCSFSMFCQLGCGATCTRCQLGWHWAENFLKFGILYCQKRYFQSNLYPFC